MKILSTATILMYTVFTNAISTPNAELMMSPSEIPSFSCFVELVDAETLQHFSSCSGSLISANSILTAKHCLTITEIDRSNGRPIAYRVKCGSEERITNLVTVFERAMNNTTDVGASFDNMIVKTLEPFIKAQPVSLPISSVEGGALLKSSENCFASGFGYDQSMTSKEHRGVRIFPGQIQSNNFSMGTEVFLRPGDSGGGAYCQRGDGEYEIVGLLRQTPMDFSKPSSSGFIGPALDWIIKNLE